MFGLAWLASCSLSLSLRRNGVPWATALADTVDASLETALGGYPLGLGLSWNPGWDPEDILWIWQMMSLLPPTC